MTQAVKLQQVQNRAARIITITRLSDGKTNKYVNTRTGQQHRAKDRNR